MTTFTVTGQTVGTIGTFPSQQSITPITGGTFPPAPTGTPPHFTIPTIHPTIPSEYLYRIVT